MRHYRIYSIDGGGHLHHAEDFDCRDDLLALAEGERLSSKNAVEVWDERRFVARVKIGNAPLTAQDHCSL